MEEHIPDYLLSHYKDAFNMFDKNKDGYLSTKELTNSLVSLGHNTDDPDLAQTLGELSKSKLTLIDFDYFSNLAYKRTKTADLANNVIQAFRMFDKKDNGKITTSELRNILTTLGDKLAEQEVEIMLKEADINGDGNINYEEFVRSMTIR
jgi:Ca2+-binding EF-hand superfamily protein